MNIRTLTHAGVTDEIDQAIAQKIILSNVYSVFLTLFTGLPFAIISYIYAPPLTLLPLLATLGVVITPLLNRMGYHTLSRFMATLLLGAVVPVYHACLISSNAQPIACVSMLSLSFALIPFLLFSLKEKGYVLVNVLISFVLLFGFDFLNQWLEFDFDDTYIRYGFIYYLTFVVAVLVSFSCIVGLAYMHFSESEMNQVLIKEMKDKQQELKESEQNLTSHLDELKEAYKKEEMRQWQAEGVAHFSDLIRKELGFEDLCNQLVSELCHYLKANQAGLFIVNADKQALELKACYAYNRKKFMQKEIAFGEGLLGQTYLEKEYVYLTEIPDRYTTITSGLGDSTPRSLLIVPLLYNDEVTGMVEVASFEKFKEYEIEFLLRAGEVIASSLHSIQAKEQTRVLLKEAQKNAETVRAQEEELRQNMEQLSAIHENMERKEKEYLKRISELEQAQLS